MSIHIENRQKKVKIDLNFIEDIVCSLLEKLKLQDKELSILILDNNSIAGLNKKYLKKDKETDVLSFSMVEGKKIPCSTFEMLGDVVVSAEKAKESADERNISFYEEFILYLIHGILHLIGYTDYDKKERTKMVKKQTLLLKDLIKNVCKKRKI